MIMADKRARRANETGDEAGVVELISGCRARGWGLGRLGVGGGEEELTTDIAIHADTRNQTHVTTLRYDHHIFVTTTPL
jgi:hypothetical protein